MQLLISVVLAAKSNHAAQLQYGDSSVHTTSTVRSILYDAAGLCMAYIQWQQDMQVWGVPPWPAAAGRQRPTAPAPHSLGHPHPESAGTRHTSQAVRNVQQLICSRQDQLHMVAGDKEVG